MATLSRALASLSRPAPTRRADPPRSASLSRPAPNGHFIKGFSQFIKASSNQKGRPLDLVLKGPIRYCAAQAVYQRPGRPRSSIEAGPDGQFSKASPNGTRRADP